MRKNEQILVEGKYGSAVALNEGGEIWDMFKHKKAMVSGLGSLRGK